ncbi:HEPN domain-containing protein [Thalassotalea sp. ND16A]|uniref:HEPN domain-containing protein n=1 Tax=Thalassotalea sp. ND16A TaxID=1535422 RepID=UPI00051A0BAF|nr:HEPN domain-containing protein [Thalassotalea sp. ND16A]KGJ92088.1 hypothetical protein ND16A_1782 [Thalassotalea sp. ND16A]
MSYLQLKTKQREIRGGFNESLGLRVHRALSWLNRSEQSENDVDSQFIFLWISFNAAYSQDIDASRLTETQSFQLFVQKLCELDQQEQIHHLLWNEFSSSIRLLIDNQYVFQAYWEHHNGKISEQEYKDRFTRSKIRANQALGQGNSPALLTVILSRLYTLRNQIIHGGATWQSSANRDQLRDAVNFLSKLMPILINIMMDNPNTLWGEASYPLIKQ